jgi:Holliday junction resolvase RusA-like endonuclease
MVFEILGKPQGKARPRIGKFGAYTPQKTVLYENTVKNTFKKQFPNFEPFTGEIKVCINAVFEVPKSYTKKKREQLLPIEGITNNGAGYTNKPDVDNISKIILDSLNGLAYVDDSQVTCLLVFKEYGYENKVVVELQEI